jgi:hypothetical protein
MKFSITLTGQEIFLLKEVQFIWNILWQDKKRWPFNTGDCLIEVTAGACLTVIPVT